MSERNYYVLCDDNCKFLSMSKEQILAAIAEATGKTVSNVDDAFITKIKEQNAGTAVKIWLGTQAEYNALVANGMLEADTIYCTSDEDEIKLIQSSVEELKNMVDVLKCRYGVCDTSRMTPAKTIALDGFELEVGAIVGVYFRNGIMFVNTETTKTTLNVNNTGAYPVIDCFTMSIVENEYRSTTSAHLVFQFNGTYWVLLNPSYEKLKPSIGDTVATINTKTKPWWLPCDGSNVDYDEYTQLCNLLKKKWGEGKCVSLSDGEGETIVDIAHNPATGLYVAVGNAALNTGAVIYEITDDLENIFLSKNESITTDMTVNAMCQGNGYFVAVGNSGRALIRNKNNVWNEYTIGSTAANFVGIVYRNGRYVALALESGVAVIYHAITPTGTWTKVATPASSSVTSACDITVDEKGVFYICCQFMNIGFSVYSTSDPTGTWSNLASTSVSASPLAKPTGIAVYNGLVLVCGYDEENDQSYIVGSKDGFATNALYQVMSSARLRKIRYMDGTFAACGEWYVGETTQNCLYYSRTPETALSWDRKVLATSIDGLASVYNVELVNHHVCACGQLDEAGWIGDIYTAQLPDLNSGEYLTTYIRAKE